jgi:alkyl hydroperoxide reductase subunit AhpF
MALLSSTDQQKLRDWFASMVRPVRLLFFTQTIGCETCAEAQQILAELPPLSDRISIEEVNLVLEGDRARQYGIDRAPSVAILYQDAPQASENRTADLPWTDSRIRFLGAPAGYEFVSLAQAVVLAGGGPSNLSESSRQRLGAVDRPVAMHVFTTPT